VIRALLDCNVVVTAALSAEKCAEVLARARQRNGFGLVTADRDRVPSRNRVSLGHEARRAGPARFGRRQPSHRASSPGGSLQSMEDTGVWEALLGGPSSEHAHATVRGTRVAHGVEQDRSMRHDGRQRRLPGLFPASRVSFQRPPRMWDCP
jgi:hypothetical protein